MLCLQPGALPAHGSSRGVWGRGAKLPASGGFFHFIACDPAVPSSLMECVGCTEQSYVRTSGTHVSPRSLPSRSAVCQPPVWRWQLCIQRGGRGQPYAHVGAVWPRFVSRPYGDGGAPHSSCLLRGGCVLILPCGPAVPSSFGSAWAVPNSHMEGERHRPGRAVPSVPPPAGR